MQKSKKSLLTLSAAFCCISNLISQEKVGAKPFSHPIIYIGAVTNYPGTKLKENAYVSNSLGFNAGAFIPIVKKELFSFGINVGGDYFWSNKDQITALPATYNIVGQQETQSVTYLPNGGPKMTGFSLGGGAQVNFSLRNHFMISPILNFSYLNVKNNEYTVVQKTTVNTNFSSVKSYELLHFSEAKTTGPVFTSKIRIHYNIKTFIGLWAEINYQLGSFIKTSVTEFAPSGNPNTKGEYTSSQMDNGTYNTKVTSTKYKSTGLCFGVSFTLK